MKAKLINESLNESYKKDGIDWEIGDLIDSDPDERMETFIAYGIGVNNEEYEGTAVFCCGELIDIEDIEKL